MGCAAFSFMQAIHKLIDRFKCIHNHPSAWIPCSMFNASVCNRILKPVMNIVCRSNEIGKQEISHVELRHINVLSLTQCISLHQTKHSTPITYYFRNHLLCMSDAWYSSLVLQNNMALWCEIVSSLQRNDNAFKKIRRTRNTILKMRIRVLLTETIRNLEGCHCGKLACDCFSYDLSIK